MNTLWSYLQNPFENRTKKSTKRMDIIATDHFNKLMIYKNTDKALLNLYNEFISIYQAFKKNYTQLNIITMLYKENTKNVETLFSLLRTKKSVRWEAMVLSIYDIDSTEYTYLFSTGRRAFYESTYEKRIQELHFFIQRLSKFPNLLNIQTDAELFLATLINARKNQKQIENTLAKLSICLEESRKTLAERLHYHFAILLSLYYKEPTQVEAFFDMNYLSSKEIINSESAEKTTITSFNTINTPIIEKENLESTETLKEKELPISNHYSDVNDSYSVINKENRHSEKKKPSHRAAKNTYLYKNKAWKHDDLSAEYSNGSSEYIFDFHIKILPLPPQALSP